MLIVETIGRIRREHFVQGKTIKEIARDLKLSRKAPRSRQDRLYRVQSAVDERRPEGALPL